MTIGELLVQINGDDSGLKKALNNSQNTTTNFVDFMVKKVATAAVAWKAVDLVIQGINYNKAAEQAEIAFGVFLGSASAAKDMIEEMRDLAKETPLEFADVRDAGKQLLAYGIAGEKVVPTMRTLADVSAGLAIPLKDLAYLYGTIKTTGRAATVDLNQFAGRGIPIWEELGKITGKTGTELRKMVESSQIGFPQIEQAFQNMTSEGGKFFQMAVKQMDSLAGSQSNLNDNFEVFLGQITSGLTGPLKGLNNWASNYFSTVTNQLKQNGKEWEDLFDGIAKATGFGKYNAQVQAHWKDVINSMRVTKVEQDKLLDQAISIAQTYPEIHKKNNGDIAKTVAEISGKYALSEADTRKILTNVSGVDDKTKVILGSTLSLSAKQVDYADRIKLSTSLQGEAVSAKQKELDRLEALKKTEAETAKAIQESNTKIIEQDIERQNTVWNIVDGYKAASNYIVDNFEKQAQAQAEEETGRQIVLGYQNAAIVNQIKANALEKAYQDHLDEIAATWKSISDALSYGATQVSSLSKSAEKFGNTDLSELLSQISDRAEDAGSFVTAMGKGDYIAAAVSGIAVVADVWNTFWGGQSEAEKKASEEARKAEEERIAAVHKLEEEYQAKFDNDLVRLQKERDERVAYARSIGADVLNIERYYAGEIAKIRTKSSGTMVEEAEIAAEAGRIGAKFKALMDPVAREVIRAVFGQNLSSDEMIQKLISAGASAEFARTYISNLLGDNAAWSALNSDLQEELGKIENTLSLYKDRYSESFDGISKTLVDALKQGTSEADFSKSIMDMLRNMAIEAAVIAGGFEEQFKNIGVMIAEALKDGFQEGEITSIKEQISALYGDATSAISAINDLFATEEPATIPGTNANGTDNWRGGLSWVGEKGPELMNVPRGAQIIPFRQSVALAQSIQSPAQSKGDTHISIQSNAPLDSIQTSALVRETMESLAFQE